MIIACMAVVFRTIDPRIPTVPGRGTARGVFTDRADIAPSAKRREVWARRKGAYSLVACSHIIIDNASLSRRGTAPSYSTRDTSNI